MMEIEALKTCAFSFDGIQVTRVEQGDVYELDDKQAKEAILYDSGGWFRRHEEETEPKPEPTPEPKPPKINTSGGKKGKGKTSTRSRSIKAGKKD